MTRNTLKSWLPTPKVRDTEGHNHGNDGRFTAGSGGGGSASSSPAGGKPKPMPATRAVVRKEFKAVKAKLPAEVKKSPGLMKKAWGAFKKVYPAVATAATAVAVKLHDVAPDILDVAVDYSKIFYAGRGDGRGNTIDPFAEHLGLGASSVAVIASHVLSRAYLFAKKRLTGKAAKPTLTAAEKAKHVVDILKAINKALGVKVDVDAAAIRKWIDRSSEKRVTVMSTKYELPADMRTKDAVGVAAPKFDDAKMIAESVISTAELDRDREVMIPKGCRLDTYQKGPAPWFFNHQQFPFPIGSAKERPLEKDCPVDIFPEENYVWGRCHFNQATKEAEITYALWKLGHLGATSIGFQGMPGGWLDMSGPDCEREYGVPYVRVYKEWELVEVSIVGVGANREALAMHASRGHVEKLAIPETMKKWFGQFVLPQKFFRAQPQFPQASGQSTKSTMTSTRCPKVAKQMDTENRDEPVKVAGHSLIEGLAAKVKEMIDGSVEGIGLTELDDVKGDVMRFLKGVHDGVTSLCEAHAEKYEGLAAPELPEGLDFSSVKDISPEDEDDDEEESDEGDDDELDEETAKFFQAEIKALQDDNAAKEKLLAEAQ